MKISSLKGLFLVCLSTLIVCQGVEAQAKKKTTTPPKKTAAKPAAKKPVANTQVLDASVAPMPVDTVKPAPPPPPKDPFAFDSVRMSLRSDAAVDRNLVKSRTPLAY